MINLSDALLQDAYHASLISGDATSIKFYGDEIASRRKSKDMTVAIGIVAAVLLYFMVKGKI